MTSKINRVGTPLDFFDIQCVSATSSNSNANPKPNIVEIVYMVLLVCVL